MCVCGITGGISGSAETTAVCFEIDFQSRAVVPASTVEMPKEGVSDVAIRSDARLWVAAGWDGRLRVHILRKGTPLAVLKVRTPCLQEDCGPNMKCSRRWSSHAKPLFSLPAVGWGQWQHMFRIGTLHLRGRFWLRVYTTCKHVPSRWTRTEQLSDVHCWLKVPIGHMAFTRQWLLPIISF